MSKAMRNNLEHFDERLDEWIQDMEKDDGEMFDFADSIIAPLGDTERHSVRQDRTFRQYDPISGAFVFRGDTFDLRGIVEEAQVLIRKAEAMNWEGRLMSEVQDYKRKRGIYGTMVAGVDRKQVTPLIND